MRYIILIHRIVGLLISIETQTQQLSLQVAKYYSLNYRVQKAADLFNKYNVFVIISSNDTIHTTNSGFYVDEESITNEFVLFFYSHFLALFELSNKISVQMVFTLSIV